MIERSSASSTFKSSQLLYRTQFVACFRPGRATKVRLPDLLGAITCTFGMMESIYTASDLLFLFSFFKCSILLYIIYIFLTLYSSYNNLSSPLPPMAPIKKGSFQPRISLLLFFLSFFFPSSSGKIDVRCLTN